MSLLMDALKKAEQAKKQTAETVSVPSEPQGILSPPGERTVLPDAGLVLEASEEASPQECEPFEVTSGIEEETSGGESAPPQEVSAAIPLDDIQGDVQGEVRAERPAVFSPQRPVIEDPVPPVVEAPLEKENALAADELVGPPVPGGHAESETIQSREVLQTELERPRTVSAEASRQAARSVFAAKQEFQRRNRRRRLQVLGVVGALMAVGGAVFYFFAARTMLSPVVTIATTETGGAPQVGENDSIQPGVNRAENIPPMAPVSETKTATVVQSDTDKPTATSPAAILAPQATLSPQKELLPESAAESASSPGPLPSSKGAAPQPATPPPIKSLAAEKVVPSPEAPVLSDSASADELTPLAPAHPTIVISHRSASPLANPLLSAAYEAYRNGDFVQARQKYQQVVQVDPRNRGALLGLAAVAVHGHENGLARELYLRVLDLEPGDPLARAGLLAIAPTEDPAKQESELKLLLEQHPQTAVLFFSLGNVYAAGQRWSEAQDAYFKALQAARNAAAKTGSVHPDYPFNLAVSLERLGQVKSAVKYYREALMLAVKQPAGFDATALEARLQTLEGGATL